MLTQAANKIDFMRNCRLLEFVDQYKVVVGSGSVAANTARGFSKRLGHTIGCVLCPEPVSVVGIVSTDLVHHGDGLKLLGLAIVFLYNDGSLLNRRS